MQFAVGCDTDPMDVGTAVTEAVGNAVRHAYPAEILGGEVRLSGYFQDGDLFVTVEDDGVGMTANPRTKGLGLGRAVIVSLAAEVRYIKRDRGVCLTMRFPCENPAPA